MISFLSFPLINFSSLNSGSIILYNPNMFKLSNSTTLVNSLRNIVALAGGFVLTNIKFNFAFNVFFDSIVSYFSVYDVFIGLF